MAKALRTSLRYGGLRQGGLQPGLGNDDIFATASLDLNFAVNKNLGPLVDATTGTNLIDFTRASSGTYVGSDGLIKTATTNLLSWSEDFTNAVWQTSNPGEVTLITGVADPLGGVNATTLFHDSGAGDTGWLRRVNTGTTGLSYTLSFWIRRRSGSGDFFAVVGDNITQTISGITSEWQRVSVSNTPSSTTLRTYFKVDSSGDEFDIFGAQLEQSSTVGEYVKTTSTINSAPRFNHDPTTGESLGLLVEESRTNLFLRSEEFDSASWTKTGLLAFGSGSVADAATAPDGSLTADLLTEATTSAEHIIAQNISSYAVVTVSVYIKPNGRSWAAFQATMGGGSVPTLANRRVWIDLENKVAGTIGDTWSNVSVEDAGAGWLRVSATCNPVASGSVITIINLLMTTGNGIASYTGDGTSGIYLWGAQLEEGSFPTSYIPTEGTTVTRAADVADISGNNFGAFNLLQYSEEFDQAAWINSASLVTANTAVAPDGTLTADTLTPNVINLYQTFSNAITTYTASVFVKSAGASSCVLSLVGGLAGINGGVVFSFTTNTASSTGTVDSVSSQSFGNGWYRIAATLTATGAASPQFRLSTSGGDVYLWGAQLEQSSTATPYIKSDVTFGSRASSATYYDKDGVIQTAAVDEARTNAYLPDGSGNFVSAGELLLEGAGTNLLLQSEDFATTWGTSSASVSPNTTTAPDGTLTADTITASGSTIGRVQQTVTFTGDGDKAISVWLKAGTAPVSTIKIDDATAGFAVRLAINVTWTNGVASGSASQGTLEGIDAFPNDWYRIRAVATGVVAANANRYRIEADSTNGTGSVIAWGAQAENGSYATSYIPTAGSQVTRAADVSTSSSNTFGNSWYRQDEGTVFVDAASAQSVAAANVGAVINDGTLTNRIELNVRAGSLGGAGRVTVTSGGAVTFDTGNSSSPAFAVNTFYRQSASYKLDSFAYSLNGGVAQTDISGGVPTAPDRMEIGARLSTALPLNGTIRRLTYWQTRLPNETLQTITN